MKKRTLVMDEVENNKNLISNKEVNPTNEDVIARLQKAMEMNIQKYGHPDPNKPMERKLIFYKGWPKEGVEDEEEIKKPRR